MLRRDRQLRTRIFQWVDMALFAIALWMAHAVRSHWQHFYFFNFDLFGQPLEDFSREYFRYFLVLIPGSFVVLDWQGFYDRPIFAPRLKTAVILARSSVICAVSMVFIQYMLNRSGGRSVFVFFAFFSFALVFLKEEIIRSIYRSKLGQAQYRKRVILVGAPEDTRRLRADLGLGREELDILAEMDLSQTTLEELVALLHAHSINTVIFNARHTLFGNVEKAIQACEIEGIEAWLVADFFQTSISRTSLDNLFGQPVLVFHSGPQNPLPRLVKLLMDFTGALILLIVSSPVLLIAAVLIKFTSPGPVFFRQQRSGVNGKPFTMYKFRSMGTDAEQLKQELAQLNEMTGPVFKITNDPRVTKVGRWLRKFSIDEFPQIFNVLRGEMSLVGPRPLPVDEVNRFDDPAHRRRLSVKPGLTCLWQVSGRNQVSDFKEWVRLDLEYIDNWSLSLDFSILLRTIPVVFFGRGAS